MHKKRTNTADQDRQQRRKEAGLCTSCRKPVTGYTTRCDSCNVKAARNWGAVAAESCTTGLMLDDRPASVAGKGRM